MLVRVGSVTVTGVLTPLQVMVLVPAATATTELPLMVATLVLLLVQIPSNAACGVGEMSVLLPTTSGDWTRAILVRVGG